MAIGPSKRGNKGSFDGYELLCELFPSHLGPLWGAKRKAGDDGDNLVLLRRVKTRPPVTRKAANQLEDAARWATDVKHERLLPILGVAPSKGEVGIVSSLFAGEPLSSLLELAQAAGEPLPKPVALSLAIDVLEALAVTHDADGKQDARFGGVCAESVVVGTDGHARLREIGVSAEIGRAHV